MRIAALDLSLTATGWAFRDVEDYAAGTKSGVLLVPKLTGVARLRHVRELVLGIVAGADVVVIEGYAFNRPNQAHQIGELGGVIRVALSENGLDPVEVPPASLKLFATGKGNAGKEEMLAAAIRRLDYGGHDHNEADALWLLQMACCARGLELASNEAQRRALAKIPWPEAFAA